MRSLCLLLTALTLAGPAAAQDDSPLALLNRAIAAHGGPDKLARQQTTITKVKGVMQVANLGGIPFTATTHLQLPGQLRNAMELEVPGKKVVQTQVIDGDKGWLREGEATQALTADQLARARADLNVQRIVGLLALKGAGFELALLDRKMVGGKPARGLKVTATGHDPVHLYFDDATGRIALIEHQGPHPVTGRPSTLALFPQDYREIEGVPFALRMSVQRDGQPFMDYTVLEVRFVDKIEAREFAKP